MRTMLGVLRSDDGTATLRPQPGLADLEHLIDGTREAGLPVTLQIEGTPRPLPPALDLSAFRIVQEALTNTLKHAHASRAEVSVRYVDDALELQVLDDGHGGAPAGNGDGEDGGHGLIGMRERVALFGGELTARQRSAGDGYEVRARLPLEDVRP
jgi:signal transduction histidine kinase